MLIFRKRPQLVKLLRVVSGTNTLDGDEGEVFNADYVLTHEKFLSTLGSSEQERTIKFDLGLVHLTSDITFTEKISPIALPTQDLTEENKTALLSGWGRFKVKIS